MAVFPRVRLGTAGTAPAQRCNAHPLACLYMT